MAECSYARCIQERRLIKRELSKWSKCMLHIVGLERIAEELMGCRKWKHYQETLTRNHVNIEQKLQIPSTEQRQITESNKLESDNLELQNYLQLNHRGPQQDINGLDAEKQQTQNKHHNLINEDQSNLKASCSGRLEENEKLKELLIGTKKSTFNHNNCHVSDESNSLNTSHKQEGYSSANNCITPKSKGGIEQRSVTADKIVENSVQLSEPVDWKPNDKCYFCIDGKLLTVNANGELVAESGPLLGESDHNTQRLDSESESNDSTNLGISGTLPNQLQQQEHLTLNKLLTSQLNNFPANMTSMDSMVKRLAAIQTSMPGPYPNFNWLLAQQQQQQDQQQQQQEITSVTPTTSETSIAAISPAPKESPSPSDATGEQPLDLSSKQSPNSSISGDLKTIRIKSLRGMPTPTERRTYTNEGLQNALQDVISGKSGTRKAAVQYNIPRSTLRNKINKITSEAKRNSTTTPSTELSSDEDGDESNTSTPQLPMEHQTTTIEEIANRLQNSNTLRKLCENNGSDIGDENSSATNTSPKPNIYQCDALKRQSNPPLGSTLPITHESPQPHQPLNWIEPNIQVLFQSLLLSTGGLAALQPKLDETVTYRELLNNMLLNLGVNLKDVLPNMQQSNQPTSSDEGAQNNGKSGVPMEQRLLLQQLQQQQQPSHVHSRFPKSETPDTTSSMDTTEACDDAVSLLKIPSFKPVAGSTPNISSSAAAITSSSSALLCNANNIIINNNSNSMQRNGDSPHSAASPHLANSMLAAAVTGQRQGNSIADLSPPSLHGQQIPNVCGSQTPPSFSLRDVITNSIQRKMNEHSSKETHPTVSMLGLAADNERSNSNGDYKKPTISVVKNIGGTDTSRFGTAPNLLASGVVPNNSHHTHHSHAHAHSHLLQGNHHQRHQSEQLSRQEAAALAAGKGTRPKRGKYRNYDRDSLIEAVKAVQRGEMSVHRAGSYYGVPHSTLEYKVKERHLMRQRKREPKPQPGLDGSTSSTNAGKTNSNIPGLNSHDKSKTGTSNASNSKLSNALKNNHSAATTVAASNGINLAMFDPAITNYASQLFWPTPPAFGALQMDFNRNANTTEIFKSTIQRFQEEAVRAASGGSANIPPNANTPSPIQSPLPGQNHPPLQITSARELAENLYENDLDGIIRKTLDRRNADTMQRTSPVGNLSSGALLDQLLVKKTPLPFTNNRNNDYACQTTSLPIKRSGSPITFGAEIKRERTSPQRSTDDEHDGEDDDDGNETSCSALGTDDMQHENNNNNNNNNNNKNNNNSNSNGSKCYNNRQGRSRLTSHDSETDGSSVKSELQQTLQLHHNNNATNNGKLSDMNGKSIALETSSSILQEKLAQMKAEHVDTEENL